jgi:WD40 repeat protein/serine/threonine protein kinase
MAGATPSAVTIFWAAIEIELEAERAAYIAGACSGDEALRARVVQLVEAHFRAGSFLDGPAPDLRATEEFLSATPRLTAPADAEEPSGVIGPYRLLERIGEGGMGEVWLAEQSEPVQRKVALKLIKAGMDSRQVIARFEAERQALALMDHPNIARVLDASSAPDGSPYFVMELVKGVPLTRFCDERRLTIRQRLELFVGVCQAVQHAHQKGIIHRDLKPSNVLVAEVDGKPVPKVIDFGVARATGPRLADSTLVTQVGSIVGTPAYMSPEQADPTQADIDTRSDVYALGVMLYELLAGSTPLDRKSLRGAPLLEVLRRIREEEPPRPSARLAAAADAETVAASRGTDPRRLRALLRGELDWVVLKALEKDRNRRYDTADGLALDLRRYLADEPVEACPPSLRYRLGKVVRRHLAGLLTAAAFVVLLVLGVVALALDDHRVRTEHRAREEEQLARERAQADTEQALRDKLAEEEARHQETGRRLEALEGWRRTACSLRISLALDEYRGNNVARAIDRLGECPEDLRGWEWHYVNRLCHCERGTVPLVHTIIFRFGAISPDGGRAAMGTGGRTVVFDARTGKELAMFPPLNARVGTGGAQVVAFSPDGKRLATGASSPTGECVILWDIDTGQELVELTGMSYKERAKGMWSMAFSADGARLAGTDKRGCLFIWDLEHGEELFRVVAHPVANAQVNSLWDTDVAFSPDGKRVVTASQAHDDVKVWDAFTGEPLLTLGQGNGFARPAFSPKGKWLAATSPVRPGRLDEGVRLWDAKTGQTQQIFRGHSRPVTCLAFSPDETKLVLGSEDTTVTVWDLRSGQLSATFRGHGAPVWAVAFSPDGKQVLSLGQDKLLKTWDVTDGVLALRTNQTAFGAALSPDGRTAAAACLDFIQLWDVRTEQNLGTLRQEGEAYMSVSFSPDGNQVIAPAVGFRCTGGVRVWDVKTGRLVRSLPDPDLKKGTPCDAAAFSPDGALIAYGSQDRVVRVCDAVTGRELLALPGHGRSVDGVVFSKDGRRLASATGWITHQKPDAFRPPDIPFDDPAAPADLKVWDLPTGKEVLSLSLPGKTRGLALSPDGRVVAASFADSTIRLYDVATGREVRVIRGHAQGIPGLAFSPDGTRLLSGGGSEGGKLWDARSGEEIMTLHRAGHRLVWAVGFSGDGHKIVVAGEDGVRIFDATPVPR